MLIIVLQLYMYNSFFRILSINLFLRNTLLYTVLLMLDKFFGVQSNILQRRQKMFIPIALVRRHFFSLSPVLKREVNKKDFTYRKAALPSS